MVVLWYQVNGVSHALIAAWFELLLIYQQSVVRVKQWPGDAVWHFSLCSCAWVVGSDMSTEPMQCCEVYVTWKWCSKVQVLCGDTVREREKSKVWNCMSVSPLLFPSTVVYLWAFNVRAWACVCDAASVMVYTIATQYSQFQTFIFEMCNKLLWNCVKWWICGYQWTVRWSIFIRSNRLRSNWLRTNCLQRVDFISANFFLSGFTSDYFIRFVCFK